MWRAEQHDPPHHHVVFYRSEFLRVTFTVPEHPAHAHNSVLVLAGDHCKVGPAVPHLRAGDMLSIIMRAERSQQIGEEGPTVLDGQRHDMFIVVPNAENIWLSTVQYLVRETRHDGAQAVSALL